VKRCSAQSLPSLLRESLSRLGRYCISPLGSYRVRENRSPSQAGFGKTPSGGRRSGSTCTCLGGENHQKWPERLVPHFSSCFGGAFSRFWAHFFGPSLTKCIKKRVPQSGVVRLKRRELAISLPENATSRFWRSISRDGCVVQEKCIFTVEK